MSYSYLSSLDLAVNEGWPLWFVRLSGWPVFLTVVAVGVTLSFLLSVLLTKAGNRSAVQTMVIATLAVAGIGLVGLAITAWLLRAE